MKIDQVKGAMILQLVKVIKSNKSGIYEDLLSKQAKVVLNKRILPSVWYPYDAYKSMLIAVFSVEAKDDFKKVISWGHTEGQKTFTELYKTFVGKSEPKTALEKFARFRKLMFNIGDLKVENLTDTTADVRYIGFDSDFKVYYYVSVGWVEKFLELCMDSKVTSEFISKSWEGDKETVVRLSW
ncbi:MAG: hypothetical protein JW891_03890 [Candidatus Lokiarchaeota archaeon]|nr:hypothetical protein [Candidatus Lokiarchaeota archaeon]